MNHIKIDLERTLGTIDHNIFGGFAEHLARCIYGGIYEPGSRLADTDGIRTDVLDALRRMQMPILRYPGGNFVSGYRWRDGVGPVEQRPARQELAWNAFESNRFGTNEFISFCRKMGTEPYLAVNCGDGDMREARDWVEYCNGTQDTALVKLRRQHGHEAPHGVKYWGIGNEVDGEWQIGYKTPHEYARAYTEFAKVMRWTDPSIKLIAAAMSDWRGEWVERTQVLLEQASKWIDYLAIHWYMGNRNNNFEEYMTISEVLEARLSAYEGLIRAVRLQRGIQNPIWIAVDEWHVAHGRADPEDTYNLEGALGFGIQLNAFIRHAASVRMANIAQIVNVVAPIMTRPDGILLQTTFYPLELYARTCGSVALDVFWKGETFSAGTYTGVRVLDVAATLDEAQKLLTVYMVNRSETQAMETTISLDSGNFAGNVRAYVIDGPDIKSENTFENPNVVRTLESDHTAKNSTSFTHTFPPHSVTALVFGV